MDLGIDGKVAMITGGSRGLGRQAAYSLAREGCKVSICARSQDQLDATVSEMAAAGYQVHGTQGDVTVEADAVRFHRDTVDHLGQSDILVNNVGGRRGSVIFEETSLEQFREGLEVNLVSAYRMIGLVLPHMREQGWGRIINISSIYGREHGGSIDYMAGKAGLIALSKHLALQLAPINVRVNSIAPGSIDFRAALGSDSSRTTRPRWSMSSSPGTFPQGASAGPNP